MIFLLFSIVASVFCVQDRYFAISEINALFDLYESTDGPSWTWYSPYISFGFPWNFTDSTNVSFNPCIGGKPWQGVECSENAYGYHNLFLYDNQLIGSIPSSIGNLLLLQLFDLDTNQLTGSIPSSIGNLVLMEGLYLYTNQLTGSIPPSIGNLVLLQYLTLHINHITGSLPSTIERFVLMKGFDVDSNYLTGSIPPSVGNFSFTEYLAFQLNHLTGSIPPSFGNLVLMEYLALNNNHITGSIPSSIGNLVLVEFLDICNNDLTGSIPPETSYLKSITTINIANNSLIGSIPAEIINASSSLDQLNLSSNMLSGSISGDWSSLEMLQLLFLQNNKFQGSININTSPLLTNIDFSNNKFTETIPYQIFQTHNNIQSFTAVRNCFSGIISDIICNCKSLQVLALDGLSGALNCPNQISTFNSIFNLFSSQISSSIVHGSIPECLYLMPNLTTLHLSGNGLTGTISDSLKKNNYFGKSVLSDVSLSYNKLTGTIPMEWQLRSWKSNLDLSSNFLTGIL
eukprot:gene6356-8755_t